MPHAFEVRIPHARCRLVVACSGVVVIHPDIIRSGAGGDLWDIHPDEGGAGFVPCFDFIGKRGRTVGIDKSDILAGIQSLVVIYAGTGWIESYEHRKVG